MLYGVTNVEEAVEIELDVFDVLDTDDEDAVAELEEFVVLELLDADEEVTVLGLPATLDEVADADDEAILLGELLDVGLEPAGPVPVEIM